MTVKITVSWEWKSGSPELKEFLEKLDKAGLDDYVSVEWKILPIKILERWS